MKYHRVFEILNNKEKANVYYDERPVWIQELSHNTAKVGFIDNFEERDVQIEDLYEDLYHNNRKNY